MAKVLEDFQEHHRDGFPIAFTWREHIRDVHNISYPCLLRYQSINTRREIKELELKIKDHESANAKP